LGNKNFFFDKRSIRHKEIIIFMGDLFQRMDHKRKYVSISVWILCVFSILFLSGNSGAYGQTDSISGVINTVSSRIDQVYSSNPDDIDSVLVNSVNGFDVGDTVLVHMTVGASYYKTGGNSGLIIKGGTAGTYGIFLIKGINPTEKLLILNSTLQGIKTLNAGDYGQIVKIPTYKRAIIKETLTCDPFVPFDLLDPNSGKGGILVLLVKQGLVFNADINVDGKGFPGAQPDAASYTGTCSTDNPLLYSQWYFKDSESSFSALKGFGIANIANDTTRGRGYIIIGGGGGNGRFSGGGGGGNGGSGGNGGRESASCGGSDIGGLGGILSTEFFYINNGTNRISLGGGGGTSSQILPDRKATAGGAGGGIVIIVCDSLIGDALIGEQNIYSRGQSVTELATAGAGGGGAGGAIILHVNKYSDPPKVWVSGGNGGSVSSSAPEACGPGGGGGSGVIWYNGFSLGSEDDNTKGDNGDYLLTNNPYGSTGGGELSKVNSLKIPIRGFLFHHIPDADTICKNDPPKTINAAPPVGGTGSFTYNWLQSTNSIDWTNADSVRNTITYTPPAATNITMYYKRAVFDNFIHDTSNVVKMFVLPLLFNNNIRPDNDTTICQNLTAGTLYTNLSMGGGNGSYQYAWEKSPDNFLSSPDTVGISAAFLTPSLTADTWYRRKVISSACKSTSNIIKIDVLPAISNNIIDSAQEICTTRTPDLLTGGTPGGGDGTTYTYKWQTSTGAAWAELVSTPNYQPPTLAASRNYRRIVISGPENTCKDTSDVLTVNVMPNITNNLVDPIVQNILCFGLNGDTLTATTRPSLVGGNGNFSYYWQRNGVNAPGGSDSTNFTPGPLTENSTFRRIVTSGTNNDSLQRCHSISNERTISILESISNNIISTPKTIWCEGKTPDDLTGTFPGKGDGTYEYSWLSRLPSESWEEAGSVAQDFNAPVITTGVDYRRLVTSGLNKTCKDSGNIISLVIQDSILNNSINNNTTVFVCFDEDSILQASLPGNSLTGGDQTNYSYLWLQSQSQTGAFTNATQALNTDSTYLTEAIHASRFYKRRVISGDCENTSDAVKIEPLSPPRLTSLATDPYEICFTKIYDVISTSIQSGLAPYNVTFSDGQGFKDVRTFTSGSGTIEPQISNPDINPGYIDYNYEVISIEDAKGCFANTDTLQDFSAALRVYTTPVPSMAGDAFVEECASILDIPVNPSIGASSWHLRNIYGITAENTNTPIIKLSATYAEDDSASVSLAYVEDIANCPSDTIFLEAVLYNNPDLIRGFYKVVEDSIYSVGDTVVIFISDNQMFASDEVIYGVPHWNILSGAGEISDSISISTKLSGLEQDNPTSLEYSISNGKCPVSKRTLLIERKELLVYDGFSPNSDGINDELWSVGLADPEVDFKFQIFSSAGSFVREISREDIPKTDLANNQVVLWDGTTNLGGAGNFIPDGTYYYVLLVQYKGQSFDERGFVIVKR
jgi:hypothetical protein